MSSRDCARALGMKMYKLRFAPVFADDLQELFSYIALTLREPGAAKRLMKQIDTAILRLAEFPEMYPLCPEPLDVLGYRKLTVENYIIVYAVDHAAGTVNLLRCFYGKQNYLLFFR